MCVCVCVCTPVVELIGFDEFLCMAQRGTLALITQEVPQLQRREHKAVTGVMSKHRVQLRSSHELPTKLLNLCRVQAVIMGAVTLLHNTHNKRETKQTKQA